MRVDWRNIISMEAIGLGRGHGWGLGEEDVVVGAVVACGREAGDGLVAEHERAAGPGAAAGAERARGVMSLHILKFITNESMPPSVSQSVNQKLKP